MVPSEIEPIFKYEITLTPPLPEYRKRSNRSIN